MKPSTLKKTIVGVVFAAGASVTPVIPQDMQLHYSYQYNPNEVSSGLEEYVPTSTPSYPTNAKAPAYEDTDENGLVSVSVFTNRKGEVIYTQIDDTRYQEMGKRGGIKDNPKRAELVSALEMMTPKVEAAIAFDAATRNSTGGTPTSVTYAHTVASQSDRILIAGISNNATAVDPVTVTYNGTSMTANQRDVGTVGSGVGTVSSFYLIAPSTGTNNLVITQGSTKSTFVTSGVGSYYGVAQTSPIDVTDYTESLTATYTWSAVTTVDNTWGVAFAGSQRSLTANSNITIRQGSGGGDIFGDTNGAQTPAGTKTMVLNVSSSPFTTWGHALFIKPATAAAPIKRQEVFFQD